MRKHSLFQTRIFRSRIALALLLALTGGALAIFSAAANPPKVRGKTALAQTTTPGWSITPSPSISATQDNYFTSVACASASQCWAVGSYKNGTVYQTLIERWDGTAWSIVSSPNTSATQTNLLNGVTCGSANQCWAVGYYSVDSTHNGTLIEKWDGAVWSIVSSPTPSNTDSDYFSGVTCASPGECWAAGGATSSTTSDRPLIELWNGAAWSIVSAPNFSNTLDDYVTGVTCASVNECWVVGYTFSFFANTYRSLIEKWDGTAWSIVTSPNTSFAGNYPQGVTCGSGFECWTVGSYQNGTTYQTLIEKWDGTAWSIITSPNTSGTEDNVLNAAACLSEGECWAVGYRVNQTLIQKWDGTAWSIVSSPNTSATQTNSLNGVTCGSANQCWAVGYSYNGSNYQTLIEYYTASPPPTPTSVVSRKVHGAGTFNISLPLTGPPGIECRSGGASNNYQLVFTFPSAVTFTSASVIAGTGTVSSSSGNGTTTVTVNLTGVTNAQRITVRLLGASDGTSTGDLSVPMGVLVGDTTGDGNVNSGDIAQTKSKSGQTIDSTNFREDVTVDGNLNSGDIALVKSKSGTALPP